MGQGEVGAVSFPTPRRIQFVREESRAVCARVKQVCRETREVTHAAWAEAGVNGHQTGRFGAGADELVALAGEVDKLATEAELLSAELTMAAGILKARVLMLGLSGIHVPRPAAAPLARRLPRIQATIVTVG